MSTENLAGLAQLRAILREIHTSGDDTMRMAAALNLTSQIIQTLQADLNSQSTEEQKGD